MDEVDAEQPGRIGDDRVAAIEDADLHPLPRRYVFDESDADRLERRPAGRELVLKHPLREVLAEDRASIGDVEILGEDQAFAVAGRRCDPIDHAARESDLGVDPICQADVKEPGQPDDGVAGDLAVVWQVIAGHYRKRRDGPGAAHLESREDQAEYRPRRS